jgi:polysaccharide biosynthesis/export protein
MLKITLLLMSLLLTSIASAEDADAPSESSHEQEYRLGVGDVVHVDVYENPDLTTVVRIPENGKVRFSLIGEVNIGGLTTASVERLIAQELREGGFVRDPQVRVIVEQYRSQRVAVMGYVHRPGNYPINEINTVLDLLAEAGGPTERGADRVRLIRRSGSKKEEFDIDLVKMLRGGNVDADLPVRDGDVLYVPPMEVFYIYGEVQRPGVYRIEPELSVMQALALGGGLSARGTERDISVRRRNASGKLGMVDVDLSSPVKPNDVIFIKESLF